MANEKCVWTSENLSKLITEVERKPCVWKKSDPKYMNKHVKKAAYEEIGAAIGVSADDVKDKLRNLRTVFMQTHKRKTKSGSGAVHQPKWEFYNAMLFMAGETTTSGDTDSLCFEDAVEDKRNDDEENADSNQSTSTISAVKCLSAPQTSKRHKRGDDDLASVLAPLYEELSKSRESINKTKGPNEKFGMELVSVLNNIRHENIVKRAKARIQLVLADSMAESARLDLAENDAFYRTQSPIPEFSQNWSTTQGPLPPQAIPQGFSQQYQIDQQDGQ